MPALSARTVPSRVVNVLVTVRALSATSTFTALSLQTSPVGNEIVIGAALAPSTLNTQKATSSPVAPASSEKRIEALIGRSFRLREPSQAPSLDGLSTRDAEYVGKPIAAATADRSPFRAAVMRPDRDLLATRFEQFRQVAAA